MGRLKGMKTEIPSFFAGQNLPALEEILQNLYVCSLPMNVRFRGVEHREVALIEGPAGWGEFAPFLEYEPQEAASWLSCALEAAWLGFPEPLRQQIPLNSTVPAVDALRVPEVLGRYRGDIREVKIKVAEKGHSIEDDWQRIRAVARYAPNARLKIDANGGWDEQRALEALTRFADFELLYAEQPVPTVEGLARVRESLRNRGILTPIAADESVRKAEDPLTVSRLGAADLIIIKAAPLGGVRRALGVVEQSGLPAVVSSALESSVGIRTGVALAAALPDLPYGCGLGTASLLAADTVASPYVAEDGFLTVREVVPDAGCLQLAAVSGERRRWWQERVRKSYQALLTRVN